MTVAEAPPRVERQVPWLGAGIDVSRAATVDEAVELSGLNFAIGLRRTAFEQDGEWVVNPRRVHIVREDVPGPKGVLGIASKSYEPVQYAEAFAFMNAVSPRFVAAGSLRGGHQGFMVVQAAEETLRHLNLEVRGEGDQLGTFAILRTSHDLSRGIEISAMMFRYACTNQITGQAFAHGAPWRWSIRHVRGAQEQLEQARRVFTNLGSFAEGFRETADQLAMIELTIEDAREVITQVLSTPKPRPKTPAVVERILDAWEHSPTVGFFPTGWGLVNALNEDFDWNRHLTSAGTERGGVRHETRLLGGLQGASLKHTNRTAHLLLRKYG